MNIYEELSENSRRALLKEMLNGPKSVSELVEISGLKQPNVSNHLGRLRSKGMVRATKIGRQVHYSIASNDVETAIRSYLNEDAKVVQHINLSEAAKDYAKAAVRGDESSCSDIVDQVLLSQYTIVEMYQDFLGISMGIVGTWYKVEAIDEAQEHMASEITIRMMAKTAQHFGPRIKHGHTAMLGCAPGSWHVIGLRMVADFLRFMGWNIQFLGANVPTESFLSAIRENKPDVVLINCSASESIEPTLSLIRSVRELRTNKLSFLLGVGGGAVLHYPDTFREAGADFTATDLKSFAIDTLEVLETFVNSPISEIDRGLVIRSRQNS